MLKPREPTVLENLITGNIVVLDEPTHGVLAQDQPVQCEICERELHVGDSAVLVVALEVFGADARRLAVLLCGTCHAAGKPISKERLAELLVRERRAWGDVGVLAAAAGAGRQQASGPIGRLRWGCFFDAAGRPIR